MPLGAAVKAAIVAGLMAGGAVTFFHLVFAEPLIDRAIERERQHEVSRGTEASEPMLSRHIQRVGLLVGQLMYGVAWGVLLGLALYLGARRLPPAALGKMGVLLTLALGWSVAVFPFIKYPANPPSVGDPSTIVYRQVLYASFLALSAAGMAAALLLTRRFGRRAFGVVAAGYIGYAIVLFVSIPASPDPVTMPRELVWRFRAVSLAGLVIFWTALAVVFGWLVKKQTQALVSV